ncbi:MAG: aminopeptidase P family protein [Acidobacteria bacterium]|nr:aminopeptidase P family protein [Acidobacteriota bacterium]
MQRRKFLASLGLATTSLLIEPKFSFSNFDNTTQLSISNIQEAINNSIPSRITRAQEQMKAAKIDLLFTLPGKNMTYLSKLRTGRSERLIALLLPQNGEPIVITPLFEESRLKKANSTIKTAPWEESESPYQLAVDIFKKLGVNRIGLEPSTDLNTYWKLRAIAPNNLELMDAEAIFTALRLQKSPEELAAIKYANQITLESIAGTHAALAVDKTELEVGAIVSQEMKKRGVSGGGLVQFGPSAALPHGGPSEVKLAKAMPVLIDVGCEVGGYASDITRTIFWGDSPSTKYKEIYNIVWQAQQAGVEAAKAGVECQEVDKAARNVIEKAGYGKYFTHRLGHGLGMDGHEFPYLVKGNSFKLQPGNVVTIEPGIYLPGEFGVRIEDVFLITEKGCEPLSQRVSTI